MNAPTTIPHTNLPALISQAAGRLANARDVAELLEVVDRTNIIYDAAKSAARLAKTKANVDEITQAAKRAQRDALEIESAAKVRLADEYDAAQAAGQVAGHGGDQSKVATADLANLGDLGLTKQQIHEARQLRDLEAQTPGVIAAALKARYEAGNDPNKAFLRNLTRGAARNARVGNERNDNGKDDANLYQTPWVATAVLLDLIGGFGDTVLDPACGPGAILQEVKHAGLNILGQDINDYGVDNYGEINPIWEECSPVLGDFLTTEILPDGTTAIIANPPYNKADEFVIHALKLAKKAGLHRVAFLLRLNFLAGCGKKRCAALDETPPCTVLVFSRRLPMMHREDFEGETTSSTMDMAWFIFGLDEPEPDQRYRRVDWAKHLALTDEQTKRINGGATRAEIFGGTNV